MALITTIALGLLATAAGLCLARLVRKGSVADRIVALDTLLVILVSGIAVFSVRRGDDVYLDVLVVTALLGFVGTATVAQYIDKRGTR
ncbi:MAG: monovalent cation/H+ antiporter complex subunit F [Actinomycetota bacterium]|nr:monovalent cation/H+ antiporter complex subunit F [Actinomycetota bacterium]MDK1017030.1 monovalent cation/H+ antiporter complex subunit F [Actinomycetota bacterium]MDK1026401.1 monovalent cation/H+ antiporter complex subunit F [Actinomycetota bacterium]MDK1038843.1 monovalent cation/H+ antiporter complex subunit F [Actinomycetota bacterium]MDK1097204.1 monovalent cation/H+ antiporter complex subunit F [Actinomycetota bacterium]